MYLLIVLNDVREFLVFEGQHYFVVHGTIPDPRLEARLPLQGASSSSSLLSSSGTTYATCAREPIVATYTVTRLRQFANCLIARQFIRHFRPAASGYCLIKGNFYRSEIALCERQFHQEKAILLL